MSVIIIIIIIIIKRLFLLLSLTCSFFILFSLTFSCLTACSGDWQSVWLRLSSFLQYRCSYHHCVYLRLAIDVTCPSLPASDCILRLSAGEATENLCSNATVKQRKYWEGKLVTTLTWTTPTWTTVIIWEIYGCRI